jgi:CRISPR-associated protein Cmr1
LRYPELNGDIKQLHAEEAKLFGSTERQATVRMSLSDVHVERTRKFGELHEQLARRPGARYLGYGVVHAFDSSKSGVKKGQLTRGCLEAGRFQLNLLSRDPLPIDLLRAIKILGLVGCLGSKARKGYGSLTLNKLEGADWNRPTNVTELRTTLRELLASTQGYQSLPKISAFSAHTRIDRLHDGSDALGLLDEYGQRMQRYRSWGQTSSGNMVNGSPSEKRFKDDHDWSKGTLPSPGFHPRRAVFGLPHNYGKKAEEQVAPDKHDRRASPLLYHVHDYGGGNYAGLSLLLKSQFLPDGEQLKAGRKPVATKADYNVLTGFLEAKLQDNPGLDTAASYFAQREVLWPPESVT